MPKKIIKKVLPEFFQDILDGKKKYELRLNDFIEKQVTYLKKFKLQDLWFSEEDIRERGIQIISFE